MSSILRKARVWVEKGLISSEQAENIIAFEQGKKSFFSLFSIIMFLGVLSIACGIVAIVSSNWFSIPVAVKLASMFIILIATGTFLTGIEKKHPVGFDAGLLFFMLLLFAAIGLVGQIYHLKSDTYKAFLFWSALAFPLLFLTKRILFGWVWEFVFISAMVASPLGEEIFRFIRDYCRFSPMFFSFLCIALFFMLFRVSKAALFIVPFRTVLFISGLWFLFVGKWGAYNVTQTAYLVAIFFLTASGFAAFVWKYSAFSMQEKKALLILTGVYALFFCFPMGAFALYLAELLMLIVFVFVAFAFQERKIARILAFFAALRILNAFFALFGSLFYTGLGMIFSGLFILGIAYGCYKVDGYLKQKVTAGGNGHE